MDKLGLLSLQVPILPTRGETGDRRGSMFMAAAEPLPLRYTPPQSLTATADAVTECVQREGDALRAGSSSVAFAAAETSSSCSSCFWDDKLNNAGKSCSADAGIVCRNACITDGSSAAHKEELEKAATGGPQSLLTKSVEQRETRPRPASLTLEKCSIVAAAKRQKDNWSAAGTMTSSDGDQEKSNRIEADSDSAAATLRQARGREPHRGSTYYDHTRVKTELLPRTSEHGADAEDAAAGVTDDTMSMVEAATSPPVECSTKENSRALQTAVAGVGSCNKLKGSSMDESACGTGTPTTRFSTEQEEDTAAAPPSGPQHKYGASAAAAGSSTGATSSEQNFSCGGGHSALLPMDDEKDNLPSYEKMPSSSEGGYTSANFPAVNTTDSLELARQDADHQQNRRSKQQSWKHDTHQREIQAVELRAQSQSQHVDKGTLRSHDNTSFSHQDQNMNSLLAVAAAMVEEHVNGLTYVRKDATSHGRRVRSEEAPEDKEAAVRAAAAALASIRHRDMDYDEFDSLDAPGKASTEATGAVPRSSGERAACLQKGRIAEGQEAADTLALALSLDAVMLGVGQEAARFSNTCSLDHDNESYPAPPQTRCEGNEGSALHSQNKKQTGPTEKVNTYSSHNPHSAAAKVAASTAAPDGAAERSVVTRGAGGRTTQVQHTNGNVYAAELPEDPELIECLKGLLTALPRKKDAEARSLLSGEMRFVRPYALQIVEVWKIHLGEAGRTALKKDISERTQADPALKRRVLAISKLKMATLEELVQIAELADLLVRTLQIANMYETERQVASVTRQSTSRRAINAAAYAAPSQTPPAATQANTYYVGSTAASTSSPGGNSSPLASVNLSAAGVPGGGSTDRSSSATSSAQTNGTTHHPGASSCSPSRTPLPAPTVTPPAASSPQAQHQNNPVSPRSRNAYSTNALLSPEIESSTSGTAAGADENAPSSESSHNFVEGLTAKGICLINDDSPPLTYESIERFASSRLRGLPMESISLPTPPISADRNLGARIRSPSANSDDRSHQGGVSADAGQSSSNSSIHQQQQPHMHGNEQQLQQSHQQLQPQQLLQKHIQQKPQHQQAFSGANETESCYLEVDATQEMREPLSGPQHSNESTESGARKELQALLPPSTSVMGDSRSGVASVSPQWEGAPEKRAASNVKQQEITSMKMPSQQRRSQQMSDCSEKDEDVIRAADLLAAVAELRVSVPPGVSVSHGKTDVSSSSPVEHDELFGGCNLESAAADALSSPCARALLAAVGDNYRLSRLLEVSSLGCLENSGISKRLYLDQDVLKLLRLAAMSGEEITTTAFHSQVGASQGSNSSSSSEAEGAAAPEVDGELCHKEQRPVRRKRMRRPAKTAIRNGSRNRNAGGHRECRLDDADTALLQQLHQQLQQLHQQQVTEAREATGEELSAALAGEVHACMSALEAEAAARSRDPLPPARPAAPLDKKKSSEVGEDRLTAQDVRHDADREDEGSESRRRDRIFAEAATLLQSSARNHRRCLPAGHSAIVADCVEDLNAIVGTNAEALHSKTRCKATWATEEESDHQCNIGNLTEGTFLDSEKEGRSNGVISIRSANSRDAGARLLRKKEEENEISGAGRSSEERAAAADATEERLGGGIDKDVSARSGAKNDTDVESRGSAAGRNAVGRTATYRTSSAIDTILGSSADNGNNNFHKGRNGVRQGPGENLSSAAPYNTRRSAAAAAGTCVAEGGEICFTDTTRSSSSYGGSRLIARNTLQGEAEGKGTAAEKHDKDLSAPGGFGDSVAEQCAREAKQLLERAFKVNDALGFLPASYRLMVGGFSREQETSSSGNNSGTGVRGKRSREQASASELDTCAVLQLLATVCLMCLKQ